MNIINDFETEDVQHKSSAEEDLFDQWEKDRPGVDFIRDGIVDEPAFNSISPRIVFVLKDTDGGRFDLREFLFVGAWNGKRGFGNGSHTWGPIRRVLKKLAHMGGWSFSADKHKSLRTIAAINVKKESGGDKCPAWKLSEAAEKDGDYIYKQLGLYKDKKTVFIACRTFQYVLKVLQKRTEVRECKHKDRSFVSFFDNCTLFESGHHPQGANSAVWDVNIVETVEAIKDWFRENEH